jgi:hypothetical protein
MVTRKIPAMIKPFTSPLSASLLPRIVVAVALMFMLGLWALLAKG